MKSERKKKKNEKKLKVSCFKAIFNAHFASLVSKEYSHTKTYNFLAV